MSDDNFVTYAGNATRDPELRFTSGGKGVCSFAIAVNDRYLKDGEWKDGETMFVDVTAWDKLGENAAASITKGSRVRVVGKMTSRKWEDKEGNQRILWSVNAADITVSLKYARCTIERNERSGGSYSQQPDPSPAPQGRPAPQQSTYELFDEEPF